MFGTLRDWRERRRTLQELRAFDRQRPSNESYWAYFSDQIGSAKSALDGGDQQRALAIWSDLRSSLPDLSLTSESAINLVLDLGRFDEADAMIRDGREQFPRYRTQYAARSARVAFRRGDFVEAINRCRVLQKKFPRVADGYSIAASSFDQLGRTEEAEATVRRGMRKISSDSELFARYAHYAAQRRDWTEALRRWNTTRRRFELTQAWLGAAQCLKEMGRLADAEATLIEASERFQTNPWPLVQLANLAKFREEFDKEMEILDMVRRRHPSFDYAYPRSAEAMRRLGREDEADEFLRVAAIRRPADLATQLEYARNAHRRRQWASAVERWARVRNKFPNSDEARERGEEAHTALQREEREVSD